jgi:hypothetical protein
MLAFVEDPTESITSVDVERVELGRGGYQHVGPPRAVFRWYTHQVADTTIKVDSAVRDRLALLAAQRGSTIRDLVTDLAEATPTHEELTARQAAAAAYIREHLIPDFDQDDIDAGEELWRQLHAAQVHAPATPQHTGRLAG